MEDFNLWLESKNNTNDVKAMTEFAKLLQKFFKEYSLETRKTIWKEITSEKGDKYVKELIKNPNHTLSKFRTLV